MWEVHDRIGGMLESALIHPSDTADLRKARGAFFTPRAITRFIANWAIRNPQDRVLEPSAGDAAFMVEAVHRLRELDPATAASPVVEGVEIHAHSAQAARARVTEAGGIPRITVSDFFLVEPRQVCFVKFKEAIKAFKSRPLRHGFRPFQLPPSPALTCQSLDDVIGTTADDSGSPNPIRNGLLQSDAELTARGHGHLKGAVALDGTGDYVDVPFEVLPDDSPAYTASVWFKPEQLGARQPLLASSGSGAISMELAETGNLTYSIQTDGTSVLAESGAAPAIGQWHHAALTYDAATDASHLYLDGEEITAFVDSQEAGTGTLARTDGLHLGSDREAGRFFQGALDDAALWNRVLTGDELATIWNDGDGTAVPGSYREAKGTPGWWEPRKN